MKTKVRFTWFAIVALLIGLMASSTGLAATVTLTKQGPAEFGSAVVGYATGYIWPNPTYPVGSTLTETEEELGGDNFVVAASNTKTFAVGAVVNAWCADVNYALVDSQTYTLGDIKKLSSSFGTKRANDLQLLANQRYSSIDTTDESAAFQLAIWAILYGTPDSTGKYTLKSVTFSATLGTDLTAVTTLAQTWLNTLGTAASTGKYTIRYFQASGTQNLIAFTN